MPFPYLQVIRSKCKARRHKPVCIICRSSVGIGVHVAMLVKQPDKLSCSGWFLQLCLFRSHFQKWQQINLFQFLSADCCPLCCPPQGSVGSNVDSAKYVCHSGSAAVLCIVRDLKGTLKPNLGWQSRWTETCL